MLLWHITLVSAFAGKGKCGDLNEVHIPRRLSNLQTDLGSQ
jgi:hypothetical protein